MVDASRTCHHAACAAPASVALAFRYDSRQVWLLPLEGEAHPAVHELCLEHADRLTVPRGWAQIDERGSPEAPVHTDDGTKPEGSPRVERSRADDGAPPPTGRMKETKEMEG